MYRRNKAPKGPEMPPAEVLSFVYTWDPFLAPGELGLQSPSDVIGFENPRLESPGLDIPHQGQQA